ncbi:hypothetical protein [Cystobacter ferrugineus]|uniref:Uncharacterized protein n=1 Tax=Cystobacter ferrugineus TaxID=83449 RepID=A0A1L9BHC4_9BACT|nr:hypothetical protein [Cystobacter ferrugineus]OJH41578.1 hypothetical protein BON30_07300 [Cystobacter ferrugineus]
MSQKKPGPQLPIENIRAKLLADPDTRRIARDVGMELEDYVEMVLHYLRNPEQEPQVYVAPDEELRAAGYDPPSSEEVGQFLLAGARGELGLGNVEAYKSQFESPSDTQDKPSLRGDEDQEQVQVDEETSQELLKQVPKARPRRM